MNQNGQISLEFMLLLVFILVYITSSVVPSVELAAISTQEIQGLGQARISAEKIANAVNRLQAQSSGAKQSIIVLVPKDANILCETSPDNTIGFSFGLQGLAATACENDDDTDPIVCTKKFVVNAPAFSCASNFPLQGPQSATIVITKNSSGTTVNVQ